MLCYELNNNMPFTNSNHFDLKSNSVYSEFYILLCMIGQPKVIIFELCHPPLLNNRQKCIPITADRYNTSIIGIMQKTDCPYS